MAVGISTIGASVEQRWTQSRNLFLDRLWLSLFVYACIAVPTSLSRVFVTGWQNVYAVHFLFLAVIGGVYLLRAHLGYGAKVLLLIGILDTTALGGVLTFSLYSTAWWWLFLASLIVALLYGMRSGVIHAIGAMLAITLLGIGYVQGYLVLDIDANAYATSLAAWLTLTVGPALLTISLFLSVATFQVEMRSLWRELDTLRHFNPTCEPCRKDWAKTLDEAKQISQLGLNVSSRKLHKQ
jgi:hypothetical protein